MKVKSKISYLGERNSILPGQMAEQLAVEVDVKNVMYIRNIIFNNYLGDMMNKSEYLSSNPA